MLKTETNTTEMETRVLEASEAYFSPNEHDGPLTADFEHGQWWITCNTCGGQWSVVDATGGDSVDGFSFERVTDGDEVCHD